MFESVKPVTLSEKAIKEILQIMETKKIPAEYGLRVGVKGGGCGVSFIIGFDKRKDSDQSYMLADIPIYIDKRHTLYLIGKEVDFYDGEEGRGFTLIDTVREDANKKV
jgi:iron-sulfur cluster assembly protein